MDAQTIHQFKIRLTPDLLDWLKAKAKQERRTVTAEINYRLERERELELLGKEARQ